MMITKGKHYSACKHYPNPQEDFDCPICKLELEVDRKSAVVCVAVDNETRTVTFGNVQVTFPHPIKGQDMWEIRNG